MSHLLFYHLPSFHISDMMSILGSFSTYFLNCHKTGLKSGILPQWVSNQEKWWNQLPIKHLIHCIVFIGWISQCLSGMLRRR